MRRTGVTGQRRGYAKLRAQGNIPSNSSGLMARTINRFLPSTTARAPRNVCNIAIGFLSGLLLLGQTGIAYGDHDHPQFTKTGNWKIKVDPSLSNSCYATVSWQQGMIMRVGWLRGGNGGYYLTFDHPDWYSLENGSNYTLQIRFSTRSDWTVHAIAEFDGSNDQRLYANNLNQNFIGQLKAARSMQVWSNNRLLGDLNLSGSTRAVNALYDCHNWVSASYGGSAGNSGSRGSGGYSAGNAANDPFADGGGNAGSGSANKNSSNNSNSSASEPNPFLDMLRAMESIANQ